MPTKHGQKPKPITSRELLYLMRDVVRLFTTVARLLNACGKALGWW